MSLQKDYQTLFQDYQEQRVLLDKYRTSFDKLWEKHEIQVKLHEYAQSSWARSLDSSIKDGNERVAKTVQHYENWIKSRSLNLLTDRAVAWELKVLGETLAKSRWERSMRLLEETLEIAQVECISVAEVEMLVKRIYSRPVGEFSQEVGGVMVCMVALAHAAGIDLMEVLSREVSRIEQIDPKKIREKQYQKWDAGVGLNPDV